MRSGNARVIPSTPLASARSANGSYLPRAVHAKPAAFEAVLGFVVIATIEVSRLWQAQAAIRRDEAALLVTAATDPEARLRSAVNSPIQGTGDDPARNSSPTSGRPLPATTCTTFRSMVCECPSRSVIRVDPSGAGSRLATMPDTSGVYETVEVVRQPLSSSAIATVAMAGERALRDHRFALGVTTRRRGVDRLVSGH